MSSNTDPNVVYVFVQDDPDESVATEDILDWLGILDQIDDVKRAFDQVDNQTGYAVRFKHPVGAHLAVSHLDGEKLKNHVVRIKSNVYSAPKKSSDSGSGEAGKANDMSGSGSGGSGSAMSPAPQNDRVSADLPHNHFMPKEYRMCEPLLDYVKAVASDDNSVWADGKAVVEKLKALQLEWYNNSVALERVQAQMKEANEQIRAKHSFKPVGAPEGNNETGSAASLSSATGEGKFLFCTASPISFQSISPALLLSMISEFFGPIERHAYEVTPSGLEYVLFFQLMMAEDAERFFSVCVSRLAPSPSEKVTQYLRPVQWIKVPHALIGSHGTPTRSELISILQA